MEDKKQEEIDMIFVLRSLKKGLSRFVGSIGWIFVFSFRHAWRLLAFIIAGMALLFGIYKLSKPYFRSGLIVSHTRVDNDNCREMISNLANSIDGYDNPGLTRLLKLHPEDAKLIRKILYRSLNDGLARRYADSVHVLLPFKVEAEVYERGVLDTLESAIMSYLENNEYAKRRKEVDRVTIAKTDEWLVSEMIEIDSLKRVVNQSLIPRSSGNGIIFGEPLDPVLVYRRAMELFDRRIEIEKQKRLNNSFEIAVTFNRTPKRADTSVVVYLAIGWVLGYLTGLILLIRRENRKRLAVTGS
jgi:hypothetical protein